MSSVFENVLHQVVYFGSFLLCDHTRCYSKQKSSHFQLLPVDIRKHTSCSRRKLNVISWSYPVDASFVCKCIQKTISGLFHSFLHLITPICCTLKSWWLPHQSSDNSFLAARLNSSLNFPTVLPYKLLSLFFLFYFVEFLLFLIEVLIFVLEKGFLYCFR